MRFTVTTLLAISLSLVGSIALATAQTVVSLQSGSWDDPACWSGGAVPGASDSVMIQNGHVLTVSGTATCLYLTVVPDNLDTGVEVLAGGDLSVGDGARITSPVVSGSGYLMAEDGSVDIGGNVSLIGGGTANRYARMIIDGGTISVHGSVMMTNNRSRITFQGTGTFRVGGDLSGNGVLNPAGGTVECIGTSEQALGGYAFMNLLINNSAGVSLSGNATVNGTLSLLDGALQIAASDLVIGPSGSISGGDENSYVLTASTGALKRPVAAGDTVAFPVGTSGGYNPVSVSIASGSEIISASVEPLVIPSIGNDQSCVQRTWLVQEETPGGNGTFDIAFQWNVSDEGTLFNRSQAMCWMNDGVAWSTMGVVSGVTGSSPFVAAVSGISGGGSFVIGDPGAVTSVDEEALPGRFALKQNYPNPFNPSTRIEFSVDSDGIALLRIFNILGQTVAVLFNERAEAGRRYTIDFNASDLSSGVYFYELLSGSSLATRRMILAK